ncbi:MAG: hypothetical protein JWN04_3832 [Myxococcaceae bacterium]|nr:hypothetical protein [Myxococcaceae bacterium]
MRYGRSMGLTQLRRWATLGSFALALGFAFWPVQGRGQQAERFLLLTFFLVAGIAAAVSEVRDQQRD